MSFSRSVLLATTALCFLLAAPAKSSLLFENFEAEEGNALPAAWKRSTAAKEGAAPDVARYDGEWQVKNGSLVVAAPNRHYGLAAPLQQPFDFASGKPFVVQYEVRYAQTMECGGSYVKLLSKPSSGELNLEHLTDKTPFTVMFGPDKCGSDAKLHFIYSFTNPTTGVPAEVMVRRVDNADALLFTDSKTHLVTLVVRPDDTFSLKIDNKEVRSGVLSSSEDFDPALEPPAMIDDPNDTKPSDWVDEETMDDPEHVKPDDWDESEPLYILDESAVKPSDWDESAPAMIPDPAAQMPEDWDEDEDGEWEAPLVENPACTTGGCGPWSRPKMKNPKYKGKFVPRQIPNPAYKGEWKPKQLPNPAHFQVEQVFPHLKSVTALAFELWTITPNIHFDNVLVTDDEEEAAQKAEELWRPKRAAEDAAAASTTLMGRAKDIYASLMSAANDNPYLYILYTVVVGGIVALTVSFCTSAPTDEAVPAAEGAGAPPAGEAGAQGAADEADANGNVDQEEHEEQEEEAEGEADEEEEGEEEGEAEEE